MGTREEVELGQQRVKEHAERLKAVQAVQAANPLDGIDPNPVTIVPVGAPPVIPASGFPVAVSIEGEKAQTATMVRRDPTDNVQVVQNQTTEAEAEVIAAQNAIAAKVAASKQAIADAAAKLAPGTTVEAAVKTDAKVAADQKELDDLQTRKDEGKVDVEVESGKDATGAKSKAKTAPKGEADLDALLKG